MLHILGIFNTFFFFSFDLTSTQYMFPITWIFAYFGCFFFSPNICFHAGNFLCIIYWVQFANFTINFFASDFHICCINWVCLVAQTSNDSVTFEETDVPFSNCRLVIMSLNYKNDYLIFESLFSTNPRDPC